MIPFDNWRGWQENQSAVNTPQIVNVALKSKGTSSSQQEAATKNVASKSCHPWRWVKAVKSCMRRFFYIVYSSIDIMQCVGVVDQFLGTLLLYLEGHK